MMFLVCFFIQKFHSELLSFFNCADDKVTELEAENRVWENSPEAQARREALNPWRHLDTSAEKSS